MRQRTFGFARHKYRRRAPGAGRKRVLPGKPRLPHRIRERIPARLPVHVTWRIQEGLPTLRNKKLAGAFASACAGAQKRFGMRVVHFAVESNHIHLVVEGLSAAAMKGLGVRVAKAMNRRLDRRGRVIGDTYHARALRTPAEVRHAVQYVLRNHEHHTGRRHTDPHHLVCDGFSSEAWPDAVVKPRTWLLENAWRARARSGRASRPGSPSRN
jgi:REP element-mobilizing transposase RayT